ncbi:ECF transporter S component [Sediminibacillus massiliensis]|uniref:ECF transporter S component n=1 Tax=Sediminibacillus massiliensis TaxID=1926277 RepID=UPI00098882AF|nr:ECF transporter S component [Sediminibacillus massiliensis]
MNIYKLTLVSILAALAVVGRFAFQFLPNIQPVTTLIIISGFFLGPVAGILLAVLSTYLSNLFLGMGIWTVWQIIGWAFIGFLSGMIGKYFKNIPVILLSLFSIFSGYLYGLIISLTSFTVSGKFLPYYLAGLPFDTYHAVGNGIFTFLLFPLFSKVFQRYQNKWQL